MKTILFSSISITILSLMMSYVGATESIEVSVEQIEMDVNFLASDELEGRANFTKGIELASNYIEQRFIEVGLKNAAGHDNETLGFKQKFSIFKIQPKTLKITVNGKAMDAESITAVSTLESLDWKGTSAVKTHVFAAGENIRAKLTKINQQGGLHFILVDKSHKKIFNRYRSFFQTGLIKDRAESSGAIVMVLTDDSKLRDFTVKAEFDRVKKSLTNLVGVLPGQSKPDEMVVFSAHYDHLGVKKRSNACKEETSTAEEPCDRIYNGADDNASGTTAVISLAQYFAARKDNARTLVFVAFAGEEIGGYGSRFFSNQLNADKIVAMINIEMIGKHSKFGVGQTWMTGAGRSDLQTLLNTRLESIGRRIHTDPYPEQQLFYRSDNATLARLGVPAHSFSSTQIDKDQYYHQATDEVKTLDINSMKDVINTIAVSTVGLSKGVDTPTRIDRSDVTARGKIY